MKYFIFSDIHGSETALDNALNQFYHMGCDYMCILGDVLNYGPRNGLPKGLNPQAVAEKLNAISDQIIAVRGNCDSEVDQMLLQFPCMNDYAFIVDNGVRLFLTHGHIYNETNNLTLKSDVLFYGHTHSWKLEQTNRITVCNTGSITFPKEANSPTFAIYEEKSIGIYTLDGFLQKEVKL